MIVVSKRAFLNILTQLMDAPTLLNATYFIADQLSRDGTVIPQDQYQKTGNGSYTVKHGFTTSQPTLSRFRVFYGSGTLSPSQINSQILTDAIGNPPDVTFRNVLLQSQSFLDTYNFLYRDKKNIGNGVRIMIYTRDDSIPFVHIVCEYISKFFGEDIMFIDRMYRNDIQGQIEYKGDIETAKRTFHDVRRYQTITDIQNLVTGYQYGVQGRSNLENFFETFDIQDLFRMYEMLFPYDPLPAGDYTKERVVYIIVSKIVARTPRMVTESMMMESGIDDSFVQLYDGISDDELLSIHE